MNVKTLEQGFLINVYSEKSCPGLLASVLEAFEDLGLNVLEAKASCTDAFHLVAIGTDVRAISSVVLSSSSTFINDLSWHRSTNYEQNSLINSD